MHRLPRAKGGGDGSPRNPSLHHPHDRFHERAGCYVRPSNTRPAARQQGRDLRPVGLGQRADAWQPPRVARRHRRKLVLWLASPPMTALGAGLVSPPPPRPALAVLAFWL